MRHAFWNSVQYLERPSYFSVHCSLVGSGAIKMIQFKYRYDHSGLMPPTSRVTYSCEFVSTPSTSVFGPNMGLGRAVGDGVRRLSKVTSEGKEEKEERVDVGVALVIPGCRVVLSVSSTPEGCGNSTPKTEPEGRVLDVVSAAASAAGEGTGAGVEGWSSNRVCTFRMRSSKTRPSKEISMKKLEEPGRRNVP